MDKNKILNAYNKKLIHITLLKANGFKIAKTKKIKKVKLIKVPGKEICHNKDCKKVLRGAYKIITFEQDDFEYSLCLRCYTMFINNGFVRGK